MAVENTRHVVALANVRFPGQRERVGPQKAIRSNSEQLLMITSRSSKRGKIRTCQDGTKQPKVSTEQLYGVQLLTAGLEAKGNKKKRKMKGRRKEIKKIKSKYIRKELLARES